MNKNKTHNRIKTELNSLIRHARNIPVQAAYEKMAFSSSAGTDHLLSAKENKQINAYI